MSNGCDEGPYCQKLLTQQQVIPTLPSLERRVRGVQDPLSNAKDRAKQLKAACSNVEVELLDAGHCPHDEVPHLVNRSLLDFMQKVAQSQSSEAQQDMLESVSVL